MIALDLTYQITYKFSGREEGLFGGGDADGEGMELQESFPKGLGAGMSIAFASEEAPRNRRSFGPCNPEEVVYPAVESGVSRSRRPAIPWDRR